MAEDNSLRQARIEKLQKLKELGINPYPATTKRTHIVSQALSMEGQTVAITGRMMSYREHGNIAFADVQDESGKMQVFFQKKLLGDSFKNLRLLDLGDFIQVEGEVGRTIAGEISVMPTSWQLLSKSLLPIPNEHFGLKDEEIRLRKRYLDLLMHPELRETFHKKTIFWQAMRDFLIKKGFLEVETPVLQPIPGGADARPFITHHFAQDMELYLRISLELPLKRLLVGGFEKVFEIGRIFRNEGIDAEHLQDYTQLEFYWAYANYNELMDFVQEMYQSVIQMTFGTLKTNWQGQTIDWSGNWDRKDYTQLLNEHWGVETEKMSVEDLYQLAEKLGVKVEPNLGKGRLLDYIYKKTIRPKLIQPMFVINHPVEVEPLAKRLENDFDKVQRMQILAMGSELGKGFSELNDPLDQRERFEEQMKLREAGDEEAQMMDSDFVEALEYGMPPAAGFGISERLFAMLVDKPVREMVFFPTMKPEALEVHGKDEVKVLDEVQITQDEESARNDDSRLSTPDVSSVKMTRDEAFELLQKYMQSPNLIKHSLAAEAAMKGIYRHLHKDEFNAKAEEVWGITGLLHDIDYEVAQKEAKLDQHGRLLFDRDPNLVEEPIQHAIKAHNYTKTGTDPDSDMDWAIATVDQLTGLVVSSALIHPDKKLGSIDAEFVLKRFNTPGFSRGVDRENIKNCETKLGISLSEFIRITLESMQQISDQMGL